MTYFDRPRSPSLQLGHVQATRRSLVFVSELDACWPPELVSEDAENLRREIPLQTFKNDVTPLKGRGSTIMWRQYKSHYTSGRNKWEGGHEYEWRHLWTNLR